MEWQLVGPDNWIFGEKVRGIVRHRKAEIYYDEEWTGREGGWRWMVFNGQPDVGGYAPSRGHAIYYCETELGIISTWEPSFDMKTIKFEFPGHTFERKAIVEDVGNYLHTTFVYTINEPDDTPLFEIISNTFELNHNVQRLEQGYIGTITVDDTVYSKCFLTQVDFGELDMCSSSGEVNVNLRWKYDSKFRI